MLGILFASPCPVSSSPVPLPWPQPGSELGQEGGGRARPLAAQHTHTITIPFSNPPHWIQGSPLKAMWRTGCSPPGTKAMWHHRYYSMDAYLQGLRLYVIHTSRELSTEALARAPCNLLASILSKTEPWSTVVAGALQDTQILHHSRTWLNPGHSDLGQACSRDRTLPSSL